MQRLFSIFPNSWPGCGIFILRLAAGMPLALGTTPQFTSVTDPLQLTLKVAVHAIGGLLIIGLWTPFAAALQFTIEIGVVITEGMFDQRHTLSAVIGLSLLMLGPGAWSVDAHLFGRKRIDVDLG